MNHIAIITKFTSFIEECYLAPSGDYHFHVMHAVMLVAINSNIPTAEFSNN